MYCAWAIVTSATLAPPKDSAPANFEIPEIRVGPRRGAPGDHDPLAHPQVLPLRGRLVDRDLVGSPRENAPRRP